MKRDVDFYEFVSLIVPGSAFLVLIGYLFSETGNVTFLAPQDFGNLGIHLIFAYIVGHLLQAIGNGLERLYWRAWKGMPSDWPFSRPQKANADARTAVETLCKQKAIDLQQWQFLVAQARSTVYSSNRAGRLHIFNGNYGMFRGLVAAELIVGILVLWTPYGNLPLFYLCLTIITILTLYRMHRFGQNYAKELFVNIAELARNDSSNSK